MNIRALISLLMLTIVIPSFADNNAPIKAETILISLYFGATPPNTNLTPKPGKHYSLSNNRQSDRLIQIKTSNNTAAGIQLVRARYETALSPVLISENGKTEVVVSQREKVTGFEVQPSLHGSRIRLQVSAQYASKKAKRLYNTLEVENGEWTLLSGTVNHAKSSSGQRYKVTKKRQDMTWIRAERL